HHSASTDIVLFRFLDKYQLQKSVLENGPDVFRYFGQLLKDYTGIIEIEVKDKLMFAYEFTSKVKYTHGAGEGNGVVKYESISLKDTGKPTSKHVIARKYIFESEVRNNYPENEKCIAEFNVGENMPYIRVQHTKGYFPIKLALYTYINYFDGANRNEEWMKFGGSGYAGFALTLDDDTAYRRIAGSDAYDTVNYIDDVPQFNFEWPKNFGDDRMVPSNYAERWLSSDTAKQPSMKTMLTNLISLSDTDPIAEMRVPAEDDDNNELTFSLLDMLKIASLDYHAARIFGLGVIDPLTDGEEDIEPEDQFIYAAVYTT
ncbi:MAG: hypothetical protein ABUL44_01515, partial [Flavobacterium sp.]